MQLSANGILRHIAYGNDTFIVVGNSGTIMTSADGITWATPVYIGTNSWLASTGYNGLFVVIGEYGYITTSTDGKNWSTPARLIDESGKAITATLWDIIVAMS